MRLRSVASWPLPGPFAPSRKYIADAWREQLAAAPPMHARREQRAGLCRCLHEWRELVRPAGTRRNDLRTRAEARR
jgi:hypothetical protein